MIGIGSRIMVEASGATRRVENLNEGDFVLNPLGGFQDKITMIQSSSVRISGALAFQADLAPVILRKHCISGLAPECDTILSRAQIIHIAVTLPNAHCPTVTEVQVSDLEEYGIQTEPFQGVKIEYFSIFLERGTHIVANNVMCNVAQMQATSATEMRPRSIMSY